MKKWFNLNENTPWIKGYEDKNSHPVYKHADSPSKWDIKCSRLIMSCYGKGAAIDIRLMDTDNDFQHQINIVIGDDGKLKATVSEQTK
tara:strand:- start:2178 stop:2441 length:264 start_codon:yes stop_codon:yes gene_type:complete